MCEIENTQMGEVQKQKYRIWITETCHMRAEKRNRTYEIYFHVLLSFYTLTLLGISLFSPDFCQYINKNLSIFLTIFTLSLTLLVFGFKFGETATQHRSCYLALQKLRGEEFASFESINTKYVDILQNYPNHSSMDYYAGAILNIFRSKQSKVNSEGSPIVISFFSRLTYVSKILTAWVLAVILILIPCLSFSFVMLCCRWL